MMTARLAVSVGVTVAMAVGVASAGPTMYKLGTATGGIAVYYNDTTEIPTNVSYFRAQSSNSMTDVNGAQFLFSTEEIDPNYPGISPATVFGTGKQFGLDLIVEHPTNTRTIPVLTGVDHTPPPTYAVNPTSLGPVAWALNDYKSGGPTNPSAVVVNTLFLGLAGQVSEFTLKPLGGGSYEAHFAGTLASDGIVRWYSEGTPDTDWSVFGIATWVIFEGNLTYIRANDTTLGMDFYEGSIDFYAVPEPTTMAMLALVGVGFRLRRRK